MKLHPGLMYFRMFHRVGDSWTQAPLGVMAGQDGEGAAGGYPGDLAGVSTSARLCGLLGKGPRHPPPLERAVTPTPTPARAMEPRHLGKSGLQLLEGSTAGSAGLSPSSQGFKDSKVRLGKGWSPGSTEP